MKGLMLLRLAQGVVTHNGPGNLGAIVNLRINSQHRVCFLPQLSHNTSRSIVHFRKIKMAETRKPNKLYNAHPKAYGKGGRSCRVTGRPGGMGLIRKYGINMKRQVFRERALDMGWEKYS